MRPELRRFFRMAKSDCCNYLENGPSGIKQFCYREPVKTNHQCLFVHDLKCSWFTDAVIRSADNRKHLPAWDAMWSAPDEDQVEEAPAVEKQPIEMMKRCECGVRFKPRSNRQTRCDECAERERKILARERVRKHRRKPVTV